jgi:serine/threonine protein kinase
MKSSTTIPLGFVELQLPRQVWWVKTGWEQFFAAEFSSSRTSPVTASVLRPTGGRGFIYRLSLRDRGYAIVRRYRRGGLIRHFTRDLYWERPFRPFAELICTEIARQRQIPTVEVLAAGIERVTLGLYRGLFVSREAEECLNLWEWLRSQPLQPQRQKIIESAAQVIARLHTAGIYHSDLNLTNILVTFRTSQPSSLIIDFDRARVLTGSLSPRQRRRNLQRLQRSLYKLDPGARFSSSTDLEIFCRAYQTYTSSSHCSLS